MGERGALAPELGQSGGRTPLTALTQGLTPSLAWYGEALKECETVGGCPDLESGADNRSMRHSFAHSVFIDNSACYPCSEGIF